VRRSLIALAATALLAVGACSGSAATSAPAAATAAPTAAATSAPTAAPAASAAASNAAGDGQKVAIRNFAFNPPSVTAKVGETIAWSNGDDAPHTVTFDDTSIAGSGSLNNGATFQFTATKAGSFPYHCKIHQSMKGTLTVS